MAFTKQLMLGGAALLASQVSFAHLPKAMPLTGVPIPPVPGLMDGDDPIVVNKDMAIALGKALFWDMNVGSDGIACGSCHFSAGADMRVKNQLNPGNMGTLSTASTFETTASGAAGGPNYEWNKDDFPFVQFNDPFEQSSGVKHSSDDVGASSGTFSGQFTGASRFSASDDHCDRSVDPVFHINHVGARRVEPRNAPTMINAIFNHRNFWDGRANNVFNGSSNWGERDPDAGVWIKQGRRQVVKQPLHLINSSLASQAVATVQSDTEMVCRGRNIADLGRKLLSRAPLQYQQVHAEDSVFAPLNLVNDAGKGLNVTYKTLIRKAFNSKYWSYSRRISQFGRPANGGLRYSQMEANFSMFFGLALQIYESTLVSDQAPIDLTPRDANLAPTWEGMGYSEEEIASLKRGFSLLDSNHCTACHGGPLMTLAAISTNSTLVTPIPDAFYGPEHARIPYGKNAFGVTGTTSDAHSAGITPHGNVVNKNVLVGSRRAFTDFGFANTGVANPDNDPGLGAVDDFGFALSFAAQYREYLLGNDEAVGDSVVRHQKACDFTKGGLFVAGNADYESATEFTARDGLEIDGSREGQLRNQDCIGHPLTAYIPTIEAAQANKDSAKLDVAEKAFFKIPTLRNVELTGPFMHNGSMATLDDVLEFYARLGNNNNPHMDGFVTSIALRPEQVSQIELKAQNRKDLIMLLNSFTDERVRYKKAPFDHPEIIIPNGHSGSHTGVDAGNPLKAEFAKDTLLVIPAVGVSGTTEPVKPFVEHLPE